MYFSIHCFHLSSLTMSHQKRQYLNLWCLPLAMYALIHFFYQQLLIQKPNKWFVLLPDSVFVRYQQLVDAINDLDNDISVYYSPTAYRALLPPSSFHRNPLLPSDENQQTSILQQVIYLIQASSFINLFSDTPDDSSMNENFLFYFQSNNYRIQQSSLLAVSCLHDQWIFDFLNENDDINFEQYKNYKDTKTYICNQQSKHSNMRAQLHNLSPIVRQDLFSPSHALLAITWVGLLLLILLFFCSRRGYLCFKKYKRSKSKSMKTIGLPKYSNDPLGPIFQPISRKRQPYQIVCFVYLFIWLLL